MNERQMNAPYQAYLGDKDAWTRHFRAMARGELPGAGESFVRMRGGSPPSTEATTGARIKAVSATQAAMEQARGELKRRPAETVYVTGPSGEERVVRTAKRRKQSKSLTVDEENDVLAQP